MDQADEPDFARLVVGLFGAYGREASRAVLEGYWLGLSDLSLEDIRGGVARALRARGAHPPSAPELRELAGAETATTRALAAFEAVRGAIREHGVYHTVVFTDPAVTAAIRSLGGWVRTCNMDPEELAVWGRKEFERAYTEFSRGEPPAHMAAPLEGLFARDDRPDPESVRPRIVPVRTKPRPGLVAPERQQLEAKGKS